MKKNNLYILTLLLSFAGYVWLSWNLLEQHENHNTPTLCLIKHVTTIPCPSCGTTTAMLSLLQGDILSSFLINPFGLFMMGALVIFPLWVLLDVLRDRDSFLRFYRWLENIIKTRRWISLSAVLVVVINWIWNISKGL